MILPSQFHHIHCCVGRRNDVLEEIFAVMKSQKWRERSQFLIHNIVETYDALPSILALFKLS